MRIRPNALLLLGATILTACNANPPVRIDTGPEGQTATVRQVMEGWINSVSADGNLFAFTNFDSNAGSVAIRDAATGETRYVAVAGTGESGDYPIISPDGNRVGVTWSTTGSRDFELRIVDTRNEESRSIFDTAGRFTWIQALGWAPDNRRLAVLLENLDRTLQIALFDVDDGSHRIVRSLEWTWPVGVSFSADGSYLAYSVESEDESSSIHVVALDGSGESRVSRGDRSEYLLGWDHESGDLLFNTFDNGSVSVWRQAMTRGRPSGPPRLVRSEVWGMGIGAVGIARGSIYYFVSNREMQVMTGAVDLESGLLTSVPSPASRSYRADWIALPTWSPDGSVLAYYRKTFNPVMNRIHLRNSAGEERTLTLPVTHVDVLHWEATGSHLTVGVRHRTGRRLMRVDVFSGAYEYVETDDEAVPNAFLDALQSGDRWRFAYRTENQDDGIVVRDLRTGATRTVWEKPASGSRPSPDDEWLAFRSRDDDTGLWNSIWIVSAAPGEPRKLFSAPAGRGVSAPTWSRDGKFLVLVDRDEERTTVYAVPMAGGDPRPVLVSDVNVMGIAFHPDGRRFAYATHGDESRDDAVWALDLPGATIQSPPPIASTR